MTGSSKSAGGLTRRGFVAVTGAAGLTGFLASPSIVGAQSLTPVRITQPSQSLSYMAIYVGRVLGLFEKAGIDLEVVITRGDGPDVQALMAGEVDFVATPPHHLYTLYLQQQQLYGICGVLGRCGINLVIGKEAAKERGVTEDSSIDEKLEALRGLTIGVSAPGSLTYNIAEYYIRRAGLKPQVDAAVIPSGTGPSAIAAMKNGIVNGYSFSSPLTDQLVQMEIADWLINNTRAQDPALEEFLHAVIYARPDFLEKNEDLARRLVGVIVEASSWIRQSSVEDIVGAIGDLDNFSGLERDVFISAVANVREAVVPDGRMTAQGSDAYQEVLLSTGHLTEHVDFDAVFTNDYLPKKG